MSDLRRLVGTLLCIAAAPCVVSCRSAPPARCEVSSIEGAVACVGATVVPSALVVKIADAKALSSRHAVDLAVEDQLFAQAGRMRHLDDDPKVEWAEKAAVARRVPLHLAATANALGPPTDDELSERTVVHAVVLRARDGDDHVAEDVAASIARAVAPAASADDFERRATAVRASAARVVVERVGPFGADGRAENGDSLDPVFVAAAFALRAVGDTSSIVETPFGWHVMRLVDRVLPDPSVLDARRRDLAGAVVELREREALGAILRSRRTSTPIAIQSGADALMASVAAASLSSIAAGVP